MPYTCINCDKKVNEIQYCSSEKCCYKCLKEPRYFMDLEWDGKPGTDIDYAIWMHDDLGWLLERAIKATQEKRDTELGSCPGLKLLTLKYTYTGKDLTHLGKSTIKQHKEHYGGLSIPKNR